MRWFVYTLFALLYLLITFFGVGPVLLADGSSVERIITLVIVVCIYILLTIVLYFIKKRLRIS
ncbi:DUF6954 family protein [Litchfieldia alkalitelluris]|uniref:DUF6954 family protein n=1 Tax=Litchfieldia alkalitelluris TaxID=304268 RepID=UPI000996AEC0|nr:hypothetical protein [Litchfieldia alkalitelluris]